MRATLTTKRRHFSALLTGLIVMMMMVMMVAVSAAPRKWTSADGRTVEAEFVSATETTVTIRIKNGTNYTLKLDKISAADREFVKAKLADPDADPDGKAEDEGDVGGSGKYDEKATGKWEKGEHEKLEYRFFAERTLRRSKTKKYPLVIYLHGKGGKVMDRDDYPDGSSRTFSDDKNYKKRPCFILVPQASGGKGWHGAQGESVIDLIKDLTKEFSTIDRDRVYVTGYSMGGFGTWWALAMEPKLFAAGVPIAGGGNPSTANQMRKIPIWAFHGAKDEVVPVEQTRKMVNALEKGGNVKYTEYPDKGHGLWTVYQDEKMHAWLFEQTNGKKN